MRCPACGGEGDKVIDSRAVRDGTRGPTPSRVLPVPTPLHHLRSGGACRRPRGQEGRRREPYDRDRVLTGLIKACEKRPISRVQLEELVDDVERAVLGDARNEVSSRDIGEAVMDRLQKLDEVAYVRFASVYRSFRDLNQFMETLRSLLEERRREP